MSEYIPRINLPVEGVEHARWLEKRSLAQAAEIEGLRKLVENLLKQGATAARPSTVVTGGGGLPPGGQPGDVVRKTSTIDGAAMWTAEFQGLMPEYAIVLEDGNASYTTTPMRNDGGRSEPFLPAVTFSDGGMTLDRMRWGTTSVGIGPIHLGIEVVPHADGEEFVINFPWWDNGSQAGATAPYYTVDIRNFTPYTANISIPSTELWYAGTRVPVRGDFGTFDLAGDAWLGWWVQNVKDWGTAVTPMTTEIGGGGLYRMSDEWFDVNVLSTSRMFPFNVSGAVSVADGKVTFCNDTPASLQISKVRASVGTAPTGASLNVDVQCGGFSATTLAIPASSTSALWSAADLADTSEWLPGDFLSVDVTQVGSTVAGSDLTVQVWAG